jgi:hypothetical protein
MKKLLKFLSLFILFILIVLFTAPILFKGKIIKLANEQINNNINAKGSFDNINLSFFKQFPNLNIGIKGLAIIGIDDFENDTLLYVESFDIAVNAISAIKMKTIEVKKIAIINPVINAIVLESGKANWDIAKESEDEMEELEDTTASDFNTSIALKLFEISNAQIAYSDLSSGMEATLKNFNFELSGDLSQQFSTLLINSNAEKLNFIMDGVKYMKDVALNIHVDVDANLSENIYILKENSFALNEFILKIDGSVEMPEDKDMAIDMSYATSNTDFKTLLSLVPAIYMRDFASLQTSGKIGLKGTIKGNVGENESPNVDGKLIVQNAMFSYPDLPKKAEDISIDMQYFYDGKQMDNSTVDINKFHINLGGNPIDISLNLKTPISDPFINSSIAAAIDLSTLADLIPLDSTEIKGVIDANLDFMGNLSLIEEEKYNDFKAVGKLLINNFYYNSPDVPKPLSISTADLSFSPQYLSVHNFAATIGNSDFALNGKVTQYLPYMFNDETIKATLNFNSTTLDINEFMSGEETADETEVVDTAAMTVFEVPGNIDFTLNSGITTLFYDNLTIENIKGTIFIRDSRVVMEQLKMDILEGSINLSGEYNTQDITTPLIDFSFQANNIDIPKTFIAFDILGKIAPIASKATGKTSIGMEISSFLGPDMKPILNTMVGTGNLSSQKIGIKSSSAFSAIGKQLNSDAFNEMVLKDISLDFEIRAGKLFVNPFETKIGQSNMIISGEQGFDKTMDYGINLTIPRSQLGTANASINSLAASKGLNLSSIENLNMLIKITGNMDNPSIKIDMKEVLSTTKEAIKNELKTAAKNEIDTRKEDAKIQARAEADKIMKQAEVQADKVRAEAKIVADKVRAEANYNAAKLEKEASNPIAKKAAKVAGEKLKSEGEKKATQLENEADKQAQKILDEAKNKSDQLLK